MYQKQMKLLEAELLMWMKPLASLVLLTILIRHNKNKNICLRISHWLDELSKTLIEVMHSDIIKFH